MANSQYSDEQMGVAVILALIIIGLYFLYQWILANWNTIVFVFEIIIGIIIIGVIVYAIYYSKNYENIQRRNEEDRAIQEQQRISQQRRMDEARRKENELKATLFYRVIDAIEKFHATKKWGNENDYHKELLGYLRVHFPYTKFEVQTGSSRPDLVIEDIAIEIKGPTDTQALTSLADKCLRYSGYYQNMIIVLFEPQYSKERFNELRKGLARFVPHVKIIPKY
jgi:hypothetical protein